MIWTKLREKLFLYHDKIDAEATRRESVCDLFVWDVFSAGFLSVGKTPVSAGAGFLLAWQSIVSCRAGFLRRNWQVAVFIRGNGRPLVRRRVEIPACVGETIGPVKDVSGEQNPAPADGAIRHGVTAVTRERERTPARRVLGTETGWAWK